MIPGGQLAGEVQVLEYTELLVIAVTVFYQSLSPFISVHPRSSPSIMAMEVDVPFGRVRRPDAPALFSTGMNGDERG
jgi:hypothetical protein